MIKDIENAAAVSGIVTVSPGISILGKESRKSVSHLLLISFLCDYILTGHVDVSRDKNLNQFINAKIKTFQTKIIITGLD